MGVKEVKPGEVSAENILGKKQVRDIGSVGVEELVQRVQQKIEEKIQKVTPETPKNNPPELKKAYFSQVGVEKNMNTQAARVIRGNLDTAQDPKNLKLIVLPKIETTADPVKVSTMGQKANIQEPFQANLPDLLGRLFKEIEEKPKRAQNRMDKLSEKQKLREKKFGKKVLPKDQDANEFSEEEYQRQKRKKSVVKMFDYLNKALGQKMNKTGLPEEVVSKSSKNKEEEDD